MTGGETEKRSSVQKIEYTIFKVIFSFIIL